IDFSNLSSDFGSACELRSFTLTTSGTKVLYMDQAPTLILCFGSGGGFTFGWTASPAYESKIKVSYITNTKLYSINLIGLTSGNYTCVIYK
ncbi:MAG: hypothetical protein GX896_10285, partial [Clostridiales bacterium]|nr:hypothetical protein [Clostridiales bacterium]